MDRSRSINWEGIKYFAFSPYGKLLFFLSTIAFANFCQRPLISLYDFGPPQLICLTQSGILLIIIHVLGYMQVINYGTFDKRTLFIIMIPSVILCINRVSLLMGLKDSQVTNLIAMGQLTPAFIIFTQMLTCMIFGQKRMLFGAILLFIGALISGID